MFQLGQHQEDESREMTLHKISNKVFPCLSLLPWQEGSRRNVYPIKSHFCHTQYQVKVLLSACESIKPKIR
jgi:hypothetical protein